MLELLTGTANHTNVITMAAVVDTPTVEITIIQHFISRTTSYIVHPNLTY
jgi:hypothetical protein